MRLNSHSLRDAEQVTRQQLVQAAGELSSLPVTRLGGQAGDPRRSCPPGNSRGSRVISLPGQPSDNCHFSAFFWTSVPSWNLVPLPGLAWGYCEEQEGRGQASKCCEEFDVMSLLIT